MGKRMWPKSFRAFKASPELAWAARSALDPSRPAEELPPLDLSSGRLPDPGTPFESGVAQEAIGERFLHLLAALAISSDPGPGGLLIMPRKDQFSAEVRSCLPEYFGVSRAGEPLERFISQLGREFYEWVQTQPKERREFGLEFDSQGRIFLQGANLQPDLEPLEG